MTLMKSQIFLAFLFAWLCPSALSQGYQSPHCVCPNGHCSCPVCYDSQHYPGFCSGIGCVSGESCCFIADCGDCECLDCNPSRRVTEIPGCTIDGCPFLPGVVADIDANNHLQPWMVDEKLPAQLAPNSKTWSVVVARLQHDFADTAEPLAVRRKLLLPYISHVELAFPEYKQSVVIETKYSAQKGGWVLRLIRGLSDDPSRADILILMPKAWSLHREESGGHIGNGKISAMPKVLDFPKDENVEAQSAAKAQAAKDKRAPAHKPEQTAMPSE